MKSFFTSLLLLLALSSNAQVLELGYAPFSIAGWGSLSETTKINVSVLVPSYQSHSFQYTPGVRYSYINSASEQIDEFGDEVSGTFNILFVLPASFNIPFGKTALIYRMGPGLSDQSFPNRNGLQLNFLLEAGLKYSIIPDLSLSLRYSHISNGYRGSTNPGLDNLVLTTGFYF